MEELKKISVLTTAAMLLAISVILSFFKIPISQVIEIRFGFLPIAAGGMLFGPFVGGVMGALADIIGYVVKPTGAYFPGFTISGIVSGVLYALVLYKKEITVKRVIVAQLLQTVVISFLLNNIWLSILYKSGFAAIFMARLAKTCIMFPIEVILLYLIMQAVKKMNKQANSEN